MIPTLTRNDNIELGGQLNPRSLKIVMKFFCSKIRYEPTHMTDEDWSILSLVIQRAVETPSTIQVAFDLYRIAAFATEVMKFWKTKISEVSQVLVDEPKNRLYYRKDLSKLIFSPRAYLSLQKQGLPVKLTRRKTRRSRKKFEQRFIGVGYNDKGTTRIPHKDGSPAWQTIASQPDRAATQTLPKHTRFRSHGSIHPDHEVRQIQLRRQKGLKENFPAFERHFQNSAIVKGFVQTIELRPGSRSICSTHPHRNGLLVFHYYNG